MHAGLGTWTFLVGGFTGSKGIVAGNGACAYLELENCVPLRIREAVDIELIDYH